MECFYLFESLFRIVCGTLHRRFQDQIRQIFLHKQYESTHHLSYCLYLTYVYEMQQVLICNSKPFSFYSL